MDRDQDDSVLSPRDLPHCLAQSSSSLYVDFIKLISKSATHPWGETEDPVSSFQHSSDE